MTGEQKIDQAGQIKEGWTGDRPGALSKQTDKGQTREEDSQSQGLGYPSREFLRRLIKPSEGPEKELRGLIRFPKGLVKRLMIICGAFSTKWQEV